MRITIGIAALSGLVFGVTLTMAQDSYAVPADTPANI